MLNYSLQKYVSNDSIVHEDKSCPISTVNRGIVRFP